MDEAEDDRQGGRAERDVARKAELRRAESAELIATMKTWLWTHAKDQNVSEPLPITSFKLNLAVGRVRVVPARDLSDCPFAGPGVDLVGAEAATAIGFAAPIVAWLQQREPIVIRTLSLDVTRRRLLVTVEARPRPRVVRIDPRIDASASAEILEHAAPLLRHLGGVVRDKLAARAKRD